MLCYKVNRRCISINKFHFVTKTPTLVFGTNAFKQMLRVFFVFFRFKKFVLPSLLSDVTILSSLEAP